MKKTVRLWERIKGVSGAVLRFPATTAFLVAAGIVVAVSIATEEFYPRILWAYGVGAMLCAALQVSWERFFQKVLSRILLMAAGVLLTGGYYLIIRGAPEMSLELGVRTSVALLALFFAFLWVPVIRSKVSFNESFMVVFKAFFHAMLYAAVLFAGCSLIITAIDQLIVNISEKPMMYMADIVYIVLMPVFFLSLIPRYPGKDQEMLADEIKVSREEKIGKAAACPKFLEILLSYIVIPLTAVFTLILILYIVRNIGGRFWTDNLLEPMLVSYAIVVILVYLLVSRLTNKLAVLYRRIFPKVLVPIVLFQVAASILNLQNTGMTHTRYYVILFGIFAAVTGILLSILDVKRNGVVAALLIGFSLFSIIPPMDAFTVSRVSQTRQLEKILTVNDMLKDDQVIPNPEIGDDVKRQIASTVQYLANMKYTERITYLPKDFDVYKDFSDVFGFQAYDYPKMERNKYVYVSFNRSVSFEVSGYDVAVRGFIPNMIQNGEKPETCRVVWEGETYTLKPENQGGVYHMILKDSKGDLLADFDTSEVSDRYRSFAVDKSAMTPEEATFLTENDRVRMAFVVQEANLELSYEQESYYTDYIILIDFK